MDYDDFRRYLRHLRSIQDGRGAAYPVRWDHVHLDLILAEDHSRMAGLQLADIAASAFFQAVEPNFYGHTEPRYALALSPRVLHAIGGPKLRYGVKPVPGLGIMRLNEAQRDFFLRWQGEGQAPGP